MKRRAFGVLSPYKIKPVMRYVYKWMRSLLHKSLMLNLVQQKKTPKRDAHSLGFASQSIVIYVDELVEEFDMRG